MSSCTQVVPHTYTHIYIGSVVTCYQPRPIISILATTPYEKHSVNMALVSKALSAASKGDLGTLKSLKSQFNFSDCCDKFGASPVHYAARAGKVDCLRWLIQTAGLSGNKAANNGATPAHDAAATGQLDCLQWLIQNGGCSAENRDSCGATPLHLGRSWRYYVNYVDAYVIVRGA